MKHYIYTSGFPEAFPWNQKNLDYEIETQLRKVWGNANYRTWNQKNLDYEIETMLIKFHRTGNIILEIKRTSITRLKPDTFGHPAVWGSLAWNQKNLDYEIETTFRLPVAASVCWLEIKRTSITRLKRYLPSFIAVLRMKSLKSKEPRLRDWNMKLIHVLPASNRTLKSKEPRLRDWNYLIFGDGTYKELLKSKEPRLRDWNSKCDWCRQRGTARPLEIKRTSITRLKRRDTRLVSVSMLALKSKEPRLRDWNLVASKRIDTPSGGLKSKEPRLRDWNTGYSKWNKRELRTWNQKNLDYEIETLLWCFYREPMIHRQHLKSKEPRLRDWN